MEPENKPHLVMVRGKILKSDDIYELPECAMSLYDSAEGQRNDAKSMHGLIDQCREAGFSWTEVGTLVGLPRETIYRQWASGGDIWVGRGTHKKEKADEQENP
jgi:hypothetical protein